MISLKISLQDVAQGIEKVTDRNLSAANEILENVGRFAVNRLKDKASELPFSYRAAFIDGLEQPESFKSEPGRVTIQLVGTFASMVETGFKPFDIKVKMLVGKSAKTSKEGSKYVDVPFAWSSSTTPRGGKQNASASASVATANLKEAVASAKQRLQSGAEKFASRGSNSSNARGSELLIKSKPSASNSTTIRRISENSPSNKWIHPGMPNGLGAFDEVQKEVDIALEQALMDLVR